MLKNETIMYQVEQYIDDIEYGKPILEADVVQNFIDNNGNLIKTRNTISAYLNRLVKMEKLRKLSDGIFYKTKMSIFGETPIDSTSLIEALYLYDKERDERIGYRIGASVLENIGITNNMANTIVIVTKNFNKRKVLSMLSQDIQLRKPTVKVNSDNCYYLQLLDTIKEIDKYHLTSDRVGKKLIDYMNNNNIKVDRLFKFAKDHYSKKTIDKLVDLLSM